MPGPTHHLPQGRHAGLEPGDSLLIVTLQPRHIPEPLKAGRDVLVVRAPSMCLAQRQSLLEPGDSLLELTLGSSHFPQIEVTGDDAISVV